MSTATDYADAVMRRSRVPMEPADFVPDWRDRPRKAKFFPGADLVPLPDVGYPADGSVDRGLAGPGGDTPFTLPLLGGLLQDSYGLVGRRLGVQANTDLSALPHYVEANWSRGSASGGGLYPVSVYWAAGPSGPLLPGLYHYAPARHGLERVLTGDVSAEVRDAVGGAADTDQFLVLGVQFWQNSFKYNSFSYHVVTMDTGALLQTWRMWAGARGLALDPVLWFDEPRLTRLLGVDPEREGLFTVVPLRWDGTPELSGGATSTVRRSDVGKSRVHIDFETVRTVHKATVDGGPRPAADALAAAVPTPTEPAGDRVSLPAAAPMVADVRSALRARRSSFGRFSGRVPTSGPQLAALLAAAAAGSALPTDLGDHQLAAFYVFVNHVDSLAPGAYRYDPATGDLRLIVPGPPGEFLQRNYFLANYNLEQAGAVIVPTVRTAAVVDAIGDRGYRLVTAVIGASSQAVYTAAAAVGIACGVALGFDSVSFIEELGLEGTGEIPLLLMMVGHEGTRPADFHYELAR